jgi:pimeloyl-ACP methyl ester carboxylesterase
MTTPSFNPVYETIENEGASLKVWHQGQGPLLILIQGGGGDGARFNEAIPTLSQRYQVCSYDRRGNGQSTVAKPRILNPMESARDVTAIIKGLGFSKATLFGTSSGGIIALQVAESYPEFVDRIVIHEIPIVSLLPQESTRKVDAGYNIYQTYLEHGAEAALVQFRSSVTGKPVESLPETAEAKVPKPHRLDYFFRYEFLVFHIYTPNLRMIRTSGVSIATVEGEDSSGVFHATSAKVQSEILRCTHVIWPGAHAPFVTDPTTFAIELHKTLEILRKQRGE